MPYVLTNSETKLQAVQEEHTGLATGFKIPLLVKNLIVRQALLVIFSNQFSIEKNACAVVQVFALTPWITDDNRQLRR